MSAAEVNHLGQLGQGQPPEAAAGSAAEPLRTPLEQPLAFTLRVPATSANLGPGYDSMGLALELRDEIEVEARPRKNPAQPAVDVVVVGEGAADLPTDASHLVVAVVEKILAAKGYSLPDLSVRATNVIPHSRGLGSSAAAIVTAVLTADQLLRASAEGIGLSDDEKLQIGSRIEGHPDNYVPALRGGVGISWESTPEGDGARRFRTAALEPHPELTAIVAIPGFVQSTEAARGLLPPTVSHTAAARNSARAALLVHALTQDPDLLLEATEDSLHQEYRRPAFPAAMALVDSLRAAGFPAMISGAGPTVLTLVTTERAAAVSQHIEAWGRQRDTADTFRPVNLLLARSGATVESSP
ncbi:homoserine kinase [Nesterenkonia massiliensis]|uniref:homoserine kinase n=1 Tax=Nesterenkonia massiliensis TaxID=1232429 RepID=UPI00040F3E2C|nr:homoserine kinase [Nesterenkonia massiliensis]